MKQRVSVVIPTIEENRVFKIIDDVHRILGKDTEIIIVDKSSDRYYNRLKKTGVKVLRQKDRGIENAIMLGLRHARGDLLASIDADGTHDPQGLLAGVRLVESGKADMALGNRLNSLQKDSMGPYLRFGNLALSGIFNLLFGTRLHDVLTGLFVMRKEAFEEIRDVVPYRSGTAFFAAELAKRRYRIAEIDIKYFTREYGRSKLAKSKFAWGLRAAFQFLRHM